MKLWQNPGGHWRFEGPGAAMEGGSEHCPPWLASPSAPPSRLSSASTSTAGCSSCYYHRPPNLIKGHQTSSKRAHLLCCSFKNQTIKLGKKNGPFNLLVLYVHLNKSSQESCCNWLHMLKNLGWGKTILKLAYLWAKLKKSVLLKSFFSCASVFGTLLLQPQGLLSYRRTRCCFLQFRCEETRLHFQLFFLAWPGSTSHNLQTHKKNLLYF